MKQEQKVEKGVAPDQHMLEQLGVSLVGTVVWAKLHGWPWWPSKVAAQIS